MGLRVEAGSPVPPIAPVIASPSPRVLWTVRQAEVGLSLWLRAPLPWMARHAADLLAGPSFEVVAEGTADDVSAAVSEALPSWKGEGKGPLATDVHILSTLFSQVTGLSCMRLRLDRAECHHRAPLSIESGKLALLCTYAGPGIEWQDCTGAVRRMLPSHVGLFKGRSWPDEAIRVPYRQPTMAHSPRARLVLRIETIDYT